MSLPSKLDFLKNLIPDPCISSALRKPRIVDNLPPSNNILIECESEPKSNQQEQKSSTLKPRQHFINERSPKKAISLAANKITALVYSRTSRNLHNDHPEDEDFFISLPYLDTRAQPRTTGRQAGINDSILSNFVMKQTSVTTIPKFYSLPHNNVCEPPI